jgi:hypothetical protein
VQESEQFNPGGSLVTVPDPAAFTIAVTGNVAALMIIVMVAVFESTKPSLALNVNVSTPLVFGNGVYVKAPVAASVTTAVPFVPFATIE